MTSTTPTIVNGSLTLKEELLIELAEDGLSKKEATVFIKETFGDLRVFANNQAAEKWLADRYHSIQNEVVNEELTDEDFDNALEMILEKATEAPIEEVIENPFEISEPSSNDEFYEVLRKPRVSLVYRGIQINVYDFNSVDAIMKSTVDFKMRCSYNIPQLVKADYGFNITEMAYRAAVRYIDTALDLINIDRGELQYYPDSVIKSMSKSLFNLHPLIRPKVLREAADRNLI